MKQITLKTEKDFDKIHHLPFNRDYSVRADLIKNMNHSGFIVPILLIKTSIVDGKERLWLIDGQNRCITARFLGLDVTAMVIEPKNVKTLKDLVALVASMNTSSKRWNIKNYVEVFNFLGYSEYKRLLEIKHSCPFTLDTVAQMLMGIHGRGGSSRIVSSGEFKIKDEKRTLETLKYAAHLTKYVKVTSKILIALKRVMLLPGFDKDKFSKKYENNADLLKTLKLDNYTELFSSWVK